MRAALEALVRRVPSLRAALKTVPPISSSPSEVSTSPRVGRPLYEPQDGEEQKPARGEAQRADEQRGDRDDGDLYRDEVEPEQDRRHHQRQLRTRRPSPHPPRVRSSGDP
jgi:hypothetical protein